MHMATDNQPEGTAVEIERLRNSIDVGMSNVGGKMDAVLQRIDYIEAANVDRSNKVDALTVRVSELEQKVYTATGAAIAISTLLGLAVQFIRG